MASFICGILKNIQTNLKKVERQLSGAKCRKNREKLIKGYKLQL